MTISLKLANDSIRLHLLLQKFIPDFIIFHAGKNNFHVGEKNFHVGKNQFHVSEKSHDG